jgi:hypothetical protein
LKLNEKDLLIKNLENRLNENVSVKTRDLSFLYEKLKKPNKEIILEKHIPFVKNGGSIIPYGWILLKKKIISNFNFEKESIIDYLRNFSSLLSVPEKDLFVFFTLSQLKKIEFFYDKNLEYIKKKKNNATFIKNTGSDEMKYFFLHPFLFLLISVDCFARTDKKNFINSLDNDECIPFLGTNIAKMYTRELISLVPYSLYKIENNLYYLEGQLEKFQTSIKQNTIAYKLQMAKENNSSPSKFPVKLINLFKFLNEEIPPNLRDFFIGLLNNNWSDTSFIPKREISESEINYYLRLYAWTIDYNVSIKAYDALQKFPQHGQMLSLSKFQAFTSHFKGKVKFFLEYSTEKNGVKGIFLSHKSVLITGILYNISKGIDFDFLKYMLDGKLCKSTQMGPKEKIQTFAAISFGSFEKFNNNSLKNIFVLFLIFGNESLGKTFFEEYFEDEYTGCFVGDIKHSLFSLLLMDYKAASLVFNG